MAEFVYLRRNRPISVVIFRTDICEKFKIYDLYDLEVK